jgi:catechol 2,3-dioxygenase-like lactoylglutathione lyase family enzyme
MKKLNSICLITQDVGQLRDFYQRLLEVTSEGNDDFAAFSVPGINLSIFSIAGLEKMVSGLMDNSGSGNLFLEFEVEDVDQEFERLKKLHFEIIKPPTTQPWGIRSVWFLDPDGNKINFLTQVTKTERE